jgi:flagellar basal body-associated protein FliL
MIDNGRKKKILITVGIVVGVVILAAIIVLAISADQRARADYGVFKPDEIPYDDTNGGRVVISNIGQYRNLFNREIVYGLSNVIYDQGIGINEGGDDQTIYYVSVKDGSMRSIYERQYYEFTIYSGDLDLSWSVTVQLDLNNTYIEPDGVSLYCTGDNTKMCRDKNTLIQESEDAINKDPIGKYLPYHGAFYNITGNVGTDGKVILTIDISLSDTDSETRIMYQELQESALRWVTSKNLSIENYKVIWK